MDDPIKKIPAGDQFMLGVVNAIQALAIAVLDDEVKREKAQGMLDSFFESAAARGLSEEQMTNYINGLSCLGLAVTKSRDH
ncbi:MULTISPECIES: hypothetical protein [unclassified Pseudomonas]|uniref:hypothetical protein n=1 Tax=unclassified Pseudomonas TaxID=196821 RepID=UPI0005BE2AC4|nr:MULTISPECIES: hypothetical protein [unclassified Pseudomonas]KWR85528.1 hypothetical protein RN02_02410 [Pseudomonas sp. PI1]MED5607778.1 hypothetical protein [Pseudomonas sp. JH-2]